MNGTTLPTDRSGSASRSDGTLAGAVAPGVAASLPTAGGHPAPAYASPSVVDRMKARWGVGFWGMIAVLTAFSLAGMTTLRLKGFVIGYILPETAPGWIQWAVYLIVMLPIYQVLLLGYGTLLGQFDFFWSKFKAVGRLLSGRPVSASG